MERRRLFNVTVNLNGTTLEVTGDDTGAGAADVIVVTKSGSSYVVTEDTNVRYSSSTSSTPSPSTRGAGTTT